MMKNNRIKSERWWYFGMVLISISMNAACQDVDTPEGELRCQVEGVAGEEDDVVGKWRLIWERKGFSLDTVDYSCNNIIYHFKPEGKLEVSNNSHVEGEYNYEFIWDPFNSGAATFTGIKIGDYQRWACMIDKTNMTLDLTPLDGPLKFFIRVE